MEVTVHKAKTQLSALLKKVEEGEKVVIRRGAYGRAFRIVAVEDPPARCLEPLPEWQAQTTFSDDAILESEWDEE